MSSIEYIWSYHPHSYFEVIPTIANATFEGEHIYVRIDEPMSDALQAKIESNIKARFDAQQAVRFKPYTLTHVGYREVDDDGTINKRYHLARGHLRIGGFELRWDTKIIEADGTVSHDSKAERNESVDKMGKQLERHSGDAILQRIVAGLNDATQDPKVELFRLFEVIEALETKYGSRREALKELGLSPADVKALCELANATGVEQSRHRGQHMTTRSATRWELDAARAVAQRLLRHYLDRLDRP